MPTIAAPAGGRLRTRNAPVRPRRVSGQAVPRRRASDAQTRERPLVERLQGAATSLNGSRLLDTIIYRRLWIPGLAVALIGIVFIQVVTLRLNADIGRTVDRSVLLERQNTALATEVSRLESVDRLGKAVAEMGMVDPAPGSTRYLRADGTVVVPEDAADAASPVAAAPAQSSPAPAAPAQTVPATPAPAQTAQAAAPAQTAPVQTAPAPAPAAEPAQAPAPQQSQTPATAPAATTAAQAGGASAAPARPVAAVGVR